jgi:hypothetical protein
MSSTSVPASRSFSRVVKVFHAPLSGARIPLLFGEESLKTICIDSFILRAF